MPPTHGGPPDAFLRPSSGGSIQPFGGVFQVGAQRAQPGTEHVAMPVIRPVLPATHRDRAGGHQRLFGQLAMIEKPAAQHPADHRDQTCGGPSELISQTQAWTGVHELWLRKQRFDALAAGLRRRLRPTLDRRIVRRSPRWPPISPFTPVLCRLGCVRGISSLTAFGLAVEIGDWDRLSGRSIGAYLGLVPTANFLGGDPHPGRGHQDRQHSCPPAADRSGLASPAPVSARARSAAAPGGSVPVGPGAGTGRESAPDTPAGSVLMRRTETPGGRQRGDRP